MWIKNAWYAAAFSDAVTVDPVPVTLLDTPMVLFRGDGGRLAVLEDRCPHRSVPLSFGRRVGNTIRCRYHGLQVDTTGACVRIPCQERIPRGAKVKTYPVIERHGLVWIWMGQPEGADEASVPDFSYLDDPAWTACVGYHFVEADYRLINDNLLDLSHESYVHDTTIGNDAVAQAPVSVERTQTQLRVHRTILKCDPPPFYVKATGFTEPINRWHTTIFTPPATHIIENGSYPATASRNQALERRVLHAISPATRTSSHYFWGVARQYRRGDAALTEYIRTQTAATFDQDKEILELQQQALARSGKPPFSLAFETDSGPIQARRMIDQLVASEAAPVPAPAGDNAGTLRSISAQLRSYP
ncbi:aromatic ring-hydroxylating dioxygenase subunit alpha [Paraburkholderia phenoliruptrix]|uniref:aromatic ring-hydroxylating dioxygenase subunit alpha n=1 Tax=Paraburkholderia phenoliruptrix TaxID=252970 RepID=UPI001C6F269A|nr:aromatic ring-hydroxylating dioxygenase subunit alpha [Paraburkholderia phenoliruptrix]MBW9105065.1 aromatic ring-hydroxylating dioxygenase subunit alpha [Paraburkholderia phenoliruptrix]MBW9129711.1 aromatic ring-hydroxylating dioxygenase subunit alpha [Paraburkholderia ginsengiterrae]